MDWLDRMNSAMAYIEANLADEISYDKAAQTACCSTYHFQRMFSFITGVPLSEYIWRRRLTLAAFELQADTKVIDVALKYGYESPEAFSRAFKNLHGVMPISARDKGTPLKAYPKMTFSIVIKGDTEMEYCIQEQGAFQVFGVYASIDEDLEKAFVEVPRFVEKYVEDGFFDNMNKLLGRPRGTCMHAAQYDRSGTTFKYMMCYYVPPGMEIPEPYTKLAVPALTWAVFTVPEGEVQTMWRRVYGEWFPTSEYEQVEGPTFEMYYGMGGHSHYCCELWFPVKKR